MKGKKDITINDLAVSIDNLTTFVKTTTDGLAEEMHTGFRLANESIENLAIAVKNGFDHVDVRLDHLESDVSILKSDVSTLKSDVSILKNDVSTLKGTSLSLSREMSDVKDELHELNGRMNRVEDVAIVDNGRRLKRLEKAVFPVMV